MTTVRLPRISTKLAVLVVMAAAVAPFASSQDSIPQLVITRVEVDSSGTHMTIYGANFDNGGNPAVLLDYAELEVLVYTSDRMLTSLAGLPEDLLGNYLVSVKTGDAPEQFDSHCFGIDEAGEVHPCEGALEDGWTQKDRVSIRWVPRGPMGAETDDADLFSYKDGPTRTNYIFNSWGDPKWYQILEDYTIDLRLILQSFPDEMARCDDSYLGDQRTMLLQHLDGVGCMEWRESDGEADCPVTNDWTEGYLTLHDGQLTIKRGYRWDSATMVVPLTKDERVWPKTAALMRSSCVHDALYDFLRMSMPGDRFRFRKMADCLLYMLSRQDGYTNGRASSNFTVVRSGGWATADDSMPSWKQHALADAGQDRTINCTPPEGASVTLDSSHTKYASPARTWMENNIEIPGTAGEEQPLVLLAPGRHRITLDVEYHADDDWMLRDRDEVVITVNQDTVPPAFTEIGDIAAIPNEPRECGAHVELNVTAQDDCGCPVVFCSPGPGSFFPVGETSVSCTATDVGQNSVSGHLRVSVDDTEPPAISGISQPLTIWPPDHKYRTFTTADFVLDVLDNCTELTVHDAVIRRVTSDEPEDGEGDGNTSDDIVIADDGRSVKLRSERQSNGNGRVYTLYLELADSSGNVGSAAFQVHVDENQPSDAVDDGVAYEAVFGL